MWCLHDSIDTSPEVLTDRLNLTRSLGIEREMEVSQEELLLPLLLTDTIL
jgi:hypothetical protein